MVAGMRNFFRSGKLGSKILRTMEALSPIEIHYGAGARALETTTRTGMAGNADRVFALMSDTMEKFGKSWKGARGGADPVGFAELATNYLKGYNLDEIAAGVHKRAFSSLPETVKGKGFTTTVGGALSQGLPTQQMINRRQTIRQVGLGAMGVYGGASLLLGESNPIRQTMDFGATAAVHTGIGAGIGGLTGSRAGMYGYFGLAAVNALREGDNFGPF